MPQKVKCPSCEAELELPDDPRMAELKELLTDQKVEIGKLREKLEQAGVKPPTPTTTTTEQKGPEKKTRKRYEGAFFDDDEQEEVE